MSVVSTRQTWENQEKFEKILFNHEWQYLTIQRRKSPRAIRPDKIGVWQRGDHRLELDDFGLFVFTAKNGAWQRTHGVDSDILDSMMKCRHHCFRVVSDAGSKKFDTHEGRFV